MQMLCASRPTWMWNTQISVTANISASSHQGICRPVGGSSGNACRTPSRAARPRARGWGPARSTRPVGRTGRRTGAAARPSADPAAWSPGCASEASTLSLRRRPGGASPLTTQDAPGTPLSARRLMVTGPRSPARLLVWPPCVGRHAVLTPTLRSTRGRSPSPLGPGRPGPGCAGPGTPGPGGPRPGCPGPGRAGPGRAGPVDTGPGGPAQVAPAQVAPSYGDPSQ